MPNQDNNAGIFYSTINSLVCPLILILQERLYGKQVAYNNKSAAVALSHS